MAIPAYMWLKNDGGANIRGSVDVQEREGSIEINGFSHNISLPTDPMTGKVTVTRKNSSVFLQNYLIHPPLILQKSCNRSDTQISRNQMECVELSDDKIIWKRCDGNLLFSACRNERV